jgi:uncharacterized lipoprotein YddW (UPF0748 family)/putative cell wall-binding protein
MWLGVRRAAALTGSLALVLVVLVAPLQSHGDVAETCPQTTSTEWPVDRVAGPDRYATAACASKAVYPTTEGGTVVLARGDDGGGFADALAGTVLARAVDGPVLLTAPTALPAATRVELTRLRPALVLVLGGSAAVSDDVIAEVSSRQPGVRIERISGSDRYATAATVSARAGGNGAAFVVNGWAPPDALVAGAPAARRGAQLLLTARTSLPPVTEAALADVSDVVIVGGYGVVAESVETALVALKGRDRVVRVSGGDRYETAASVARHFAVEGRIHMVNGRDQSMADAISAGWSAARADGGVVLYAERDGPGAGTDRYLRLGGLGANEPIRLVGGSATLSCVLVGALETRYAEAAAGGPPPQMRAVWVHLFDDTLKSRPSIDAMLSSAAAANLNTVIIEVVRRQDAYYTSDVLPRTPDPALPDDLDVLARVLAAAHDRGLEVHAWYPALPAWHSAYQGLVLPLWQAHGMGSADPWVSVDHAGAQGLFFDPGVPQVGDHVVAVTRELALRYPVDAVHIDYLRYESDEWGYHPASLARFRAAHGLAPTYTPPPEGDWRWDAWRREQTRALAERIRDAVHGARPGTAVTLAGSTMGAPPQSTTDYTNTRAWGDVFQAWPQWLATGVVDAVFPMNYFREPTHATWYDGWVAFEQRLNDDCAVTRPPCLVAVGQAGYLNTVPDSLSQLEQGLAATGGVVVYSYQQSAVDGSAALLHVLRSTLFGTPAPAPPMR